MEPPKTFYAGDRSELRAWLAANFDKEKDVWSLFSNVNSAKMAHSNNDDWEYFTGFPAAYRRIELLPWLSNSRIVLAIY